MHSKVDSKNSTFSTRGYAIVIVAKDENKLLKLVQNVDVSAEASK
jgi:hypothetical protein